MPGHVLVVEDERPIRDMLVSALEQAGYSTSQAASGVEALESVAERAPDVLLLDLALPEMDGWQVLDRMRSNPRLARIPALILSGSPRTAWNPENIRGVMAYVSKPFHIDSVLREVALLYQYTQDRQDPN